MRSKLRPYQSEALEWALKTANMRGGAVVSLPTGTGKTLVAIAFVERCLKRSSKALVLEPTRFLVEQTAKRFRYEGIDASMIHSGVKERDWSRKVIVTTPESALSYLRKRYGMLPRSRAVELASREFQIVVIDECHHTVGNDPFAQVMQYLHHSTKLGLSALIPRRRTGEITHYIGPIRRWDFSDLKGKGYEKPYMIAEVYEAPLRPIEEELYRRLYELWLSNPLVSNFAALALTTLSRDGCDALRDSANRPTTFAEFLLKNIPIASLPREPHKLAVLERVLEDYEGNYEKALVFVNRRCTAELLAQRFSHFNPVKVIGGREYADPKARKNLLEEARRPETRLIIATSAGDEGIDVPEVDLLIFWSHVSSPLRLYQRLGRGLRPALEEGKVKYAVFIVTPGTRDYDALPESLVALAREGVDVAGIFDDMSSSALGEGLMMAQKVREVSHQLGARGVGSEALVYSLSPRYASAKVEKKILRELEESVRVGAIFYFYDVSDVYSEIQSRAEMGDTEVYVLLGLNERRYAPLDELEDVMRSSPENFMDSPLCIDPVSSLEIREAGEDIVQWFKIEMYKLVTSGAKASRVASLFASLASECPTALVKWRFKVSSVLIPINDHPMRLTLAAEYGPYMAKNIKQIKAALYNTASLWNLISGLAVGSEGVSLCDRMVRITRARG